MIGRRAPLVALGALVAGLSLAGAAGAEAGLGVTVDRGRVAVNLGETFAFRTTIANRADRATDGVIAHLNLLSLREGLYVDPEDWSTERTQYLGSIPARGSRTLTWKVKAVSGGRLAAYVTVLSATRPSRPPATSRAVEIEVAEQTKVNPGGILPLALGVPALLGLLTGGVRLARRRR